ncbi:hypothetical protein niasHT_015683 [Heterodera trifolii]|uniref:Serine/threonine-protein phosphatase n=1 Tax=Heterodera trifolii TaxID=157864 RepID=A0ABD2L5Q9_9BILA
MNEEYCFSTSTAVAQSWTQTNFREVDEQPDNLVDALIAKLSRTTFEQFTSEVSAQDIHKLCDVTVSVLQQQSMLIRLQPPVVLCGDIHGQFRDLLRIFKTMGFPPDKKYLFLGDYVDRGTQSLETMVLLFCYKVKYPDSVILLRGNHECSNMNRAYGFFEEVERRYGQMDAYALWNHFNQTFAWLPYVGLIGNKILCMHGGISDKLTSLEQLNDLRPTTEPPNPSLEIDLLWADPVPGIQGVRPNNRGASVQFGEDMVHKICNLLGVDLIIRAHQVVQGGVEFFADRRLITLFSAPHYENMHNTGAIIAIAEDLSYTVHTFPPL